ncbi:MAG TPA: hypothetical protein DEA40_00300, partial [Parvularcula sp.]|nr:hypothetical protein [Parvularcula sp.]
RDRIGLEVGDAAPTQVKTGNVDAYDLYLKARALFQARRNLDAADALLADALAIDPRFADALAIRAAIHHFGGEYGAQFDDEPAARKQGREFARQALALDANSSLANGVVALIDLYDRIDETGSADYEMIFARFEQALALDPTNANALNWQGISYAYVGDNQRAAAIHRRCIEVDPALAACRSNLAIELIALGRRQDAATVVDDAIDAGAFPFSPAQMILLAELKRRDAFLLLSLNIDALKGFHKFNALYAALSAPDGDHRALGAEIKTLFAANKAASRAHVLLNALGDFERPPLIIAHWGDVLRPYRRSPEFKAHMRASGVYDYWRKAGFPPQCKPVGKDDFECE